MPLPHDPDGDAPAAVHVRLERDLLAAVRAFAEQTGRTRNEAVEHLLRRGLDAEAAGPGTAGTDGHERGRTGADDAAHPAQDSPGAQRRRVIDTHAGETAALPDALLDLLRRPSPCFVTTLMPDGSPQLTQTWVDTDGEHVVINTIVGHQKARNIERDPRVAVAVADPDRPSRYFAVRGRVVRATTEGGDEHIEQLAQRYLRRSYPGFGGGPETRLVLTVAADSIHAVG